jgi:hypothetical protein
MIISVLIYIATGGPVFYSADEKFATATEKGVGSASEAGNG